MKKTGTLFTWLMFGFLAEMFLLALAGIELQAVLFFNFLYAGGFFIVYRIAIDWKKHSLTKWEKSLKNYITGNSGYDRLKFSIIGGTGLLLMNVNIILAGLVSAQQLFALSIASVAISNVLSEGIRQIANKIAFILMQRNLHKTEKEVEV